MNQSSEHSNIWLATKPYIPFLEELIVCLRAHERYIEAHWVGILIWHFRTYEELVTYHDILKRYYECYARLLEVPEVKEEPEALEYYDSDSDTIPLEY